MLKPKVFVSVSAVILSACVGAQDFSMAAPDSEYDIFSITPDESLVSEAEASGGVDLRSRSHAISVEYPPLSAPNYDTPSQASRTSCDLSVLDSGVVYIDNSAGACKTSPITPVLRGSSEEAAASTGAASNATSIDRYGAEKSYYTPIYSVVGTDYAGRQLGASSPSYVSVLEGMAFCRVNVITGKWFCDGPKKSTIGYVDDTVVEALAYAGCSGLTAPDARVDYRDGWLFFCGQPLSGVSDKDISGIYGVPEGMLRARIKYMCEAYDKSKCFIAGG